MGNFVSLESNFDFIRRKNFFIYGFISSFVWMCFHFTLVFFFGLQLGSILLVGIFLGIGNAVSFVVDSPVGVLQKYFSAKKLFIASAIFMLVVSVIFLYFIYNAKTLDSVNGDFFSTTMLKNLLSSVMNLLLLLVSVVLYGIIKELSDVTSLSYIMNNADPSEYAELLSKNGIFSGIGSLAGLVISGVILLFSPFIAVSTLVILVILFITFIVIYFDNSNQTINIDINQIKKLKFISPKETIESVKQYTVTQIQKADFAKLTAGAKFIFLKPLEIKKEINWKDVYLTTKNDIKSFINILFKPPYSHKLIMLSSIIIFFGFWDTFVITFLIEFLDKIINKSGDNVLVQTKLMTGYVFIAILAIPAYGLQLKFISLSKKIGNFLIIFAGVLFSGISIFLFGFFEGFTIILFLGLINSIGYAAAMPLAQGDFSEEYNNVYAAKNNLSEIDSNASSSPLKMILNLANVIGLLLGGLLVFVLGFNATFVIFGIFLLVLFGFGIVNKIKRKL
ncbi:MFS transporter [Candidatus Gracilibacteria bacterium]|nr:MFS transporter [Candidatus Gracilibacteria bacterium]